MNVEEKNKLLSYRADLITIVVDLQRVISKQENLAYYGQFTKERARKNIEEFEEKIQYNFDLIRELEKQLERDYNIVLKFSD